MLQNPTSFKARSVINTNILLYYFMFFSYFLIQNNYILSIILLFRFIVYFKFLIFRYDEKYVIEIVCYQTK